jgi:hypothetical protein
VLNKSDLKNVKLLKRGRGGEHEKFYDIIPTSSDELREI